MPEVDALLRARAIEEVTAAFYARFSSRKQNKLSADEQIERGLDLAAKGGIRLNKFPTVAYQLRFPPEWLVKDEGKSARTTSREGYARILHGIRTKAFKVLIVDDLSRVCRELGAQIDLYNLLRFHEIECYSICDGISSEDPGAYTLFAVKGIINDEGNKAHAYRTKRGLAARAAKGFSAGDICLGFCSIATEERRTDGASVVGAYYKISINEEEAKTVRLIFDLKLGEADHPRAIPGNKMGNAAIARFLTEHGYKGSRRSQKISGKSQNWNSSAIYQVLRNEKYIGLWTWNRTSLAINPDTRKKVKKPMRQFEWVGHQKNAEGVELVKDESGQRVREDLVLISRNKWDAVQRIIHADGRVYQSRRERHSSRRPGGRPRGSGPKTLLSGVLFCGCCAAHMHQTSGTRGGFFGCFARIKDGEGACTNGRLLSRERVETRVVAVLRSILLDHKVLAESVTRANQMIMERMAVAPGELDKLTGQEAKLEREIKNLQVIAMGAEDDGDLAETTALLRAKERELRFVREQTRQLRSTGASVDKLLLTPFALKARYEALAEYFESDPERANAALRLLIPEGVRCIPGDLGDRPCSRFNNPWRIEGRILVGSSGSASGDPRAFAEDI